MRDYQTKLKEKLREALSAVLPIVCIVLLLSFTIAPIPTGILILFLFGAVLLIAGMMFFTLGAELAMTPVGEKVGARMAKTNRLPVAVALAFELGFIITISEPDLQVLAEQVPAVPNLILILAVAVGVGLFLVVAVLRMLFSKSLNKLLIVFYVLVFAIAFFVPEDFLAVAFDSGGVTTGPMTVPFIMALGVGFAAVRSDKHAENDSFGLVALCSIGPILAVLLLGVLYNPGDTTYIASEIPQIADSSELFYTFLSGFPKYIREIAVSLLPIVMFFAVFQIFALKLKKRELLKIIIGLVYTYVGLVLFLTGVNVGFMPAGNYLGQTLAGLEWNRIIIPIGVVMGYFIVRAEPAVYVLREQVEEITSGAVSGKALSTSLSIGVAVSVGLALIRVLTGVSVLWLVIPGYAIALLLSFFTPKIFTAIAFDSGGVASGPMTATFLLPFAIGACTATGGNVVRDAFGVVAMVAMTPLITIQIFGVLYKRKARRAEFAETALPVVEPLADLEIIEL